MRSKKNSTILIFGSIAAICMALVMIGAWRAGPAAFIGWPVWAGRSVVVLLAAIAAIIEKDVQGKVLGFRQALRVTYGVVAMGVVTENIFEWLVPNVFDPSFYHRLLSLILSNAQYAYHRMGATDEQVRQALDDIRNNNQFSVARVTQGTAFELVLFFIVAVLVAAVVKTNKAAVPASKQS